MGFDSRPVSAQGNGDEPYIVVQVVLTERFLGTSSGEESLTNLQDVINRYAKRGYRLHTMSTTSSGSKGAFGFGGDKIQATLVFERRDFLR